METWEQVKPGSVWRKTGVVENQAENHRNNVEISGKIHGKNTSETGKIHGKTDENHGGTMRSSSRNGDLIDVCLISW